MADKTVAGILDLRFELEPVDTLFFRDARPFEPASRAASGLPVPQTLAGALRTAAIEAHGIDPASIGGRIRDGASFAGALAAFGPAAEGIAEMRVRGPWFRRETDPAPLVPVPASLRRHENSGDLVRLDPLADPPPGWQAPEEGMLPLWRRCREGAATVEGYLTADGLGRFLDGMTPGAADIVSPDTLYSFENRTGVGVDGNTGTAGEGRIYGIRMLSLRRNVRIVCQASGPEDALSPLRDTGLMRFGGEGRQVRVHALQGAFRWPGIAPDDRSGRLLLLTTPAHFGGWRPSMLRPVAAAVPGYDAVSGWDLARGGPRPNRFLAPAGSVYFLPPGEGPLPGSIVAPDEARVGWGDFVEGNWNYA